ncbi:MAG: hypothetical protein LBR69_00395 [Endomicrobium sp.]|jgi:hypothetical protein|nr:hypothetical protein [Endomicrobium sp.]
MRILISTAIAVLVTANAFCLEPNLETLKKEYKEFSVRCPLDGTEFVFKKLQSVELFAIMLDGQPLGILVSPDPVPKCPKDNFIVYKNDFSENELKILKSFTASDEYKKLLENETDYWIIAQMQRKLSAPEKQILASMQSATWEAYNAYDKDKYFRYALAAVKFIDEMKSPSDEDVYLKGEFYRRTGNLDEAAAVFNGLEKANVKDYRLMKKVRQQLNLIEDGITASGRTEI